MGSFAHAGKFTNTHGGHQHHDTPTVYYGEAPPDPESEGVALNPGDLWIETVPASDGE